MSENTTAAPEKADDSINYKDAISYWSSVPATVTGVLGGFGETTPVPKVDVSGSMGFLRRLGLSVQAGEGQVKYGLDIGAGIGRVTRDFLSKVCDRVDLLEPVEPFVQEAHKQLAPLKEQGKIGEIFQLGIQDFQPEDEKYWLIWCQWCVGQVPDKVLVEFFQKCKKALQSEGGVIVVKENNSPVSDDFDETDSSVTRTDETFRRIFKEAGLRLIMTAVQKGMPKDLYPVRMYALKPDVAVS